MPRCVWIAVLLVLASAYFGSVAAAATLEPIGTFQQPIFVTSDPKNPDRLLVAERKGTVVEVGAVGINAFANLSALVSCCEVERGLLSIAPAPDFNSSGRFYAAYTGTLAAGGQEGDVHIDSFRPDPQNGSQLIREPVLSVDHAQNPNHNGGQLQFGPDGYLYISLGDGGGEGDPLGSGRDTEALLGKILRIDPRPGEVPPYAVPSSNPFVGGAGLDEIWAYGLRNPWRFSFDRTSGDMVIGDVGQGAREEVDYTRSPAPGVVAGGGANYGWNCREGLIAYLGAPVECEGIGGFTDPVFDYVHQNPAEGAAYGCSIIGGYVARDPSLGDLYGRYLYADYCIGQIRSLVLPGSGSGQAVGDHAEGPIVTKPTSFGEDSCGRLYVASDEGPVYRLVGATPAQCHGSTSTSGSGMALAPRRRQARLHLRVKSAGSRVKIVAQVFPCLDHAGARVQLNRGGRRLAVKALDRHCTSRFFARIVVRSTFRALLRGLAIRSPRLIVQAPRLRR